MNGEDRMHRQTCGNPDCWCHENEETLEKVNQRMAELEVEVERLKKLAIDRDLFNEPLGAKINDTYLVALNAKNEIVGSSIAVPVQWCGDKMTIQRGKWGINFSRDCSPRKVGLALQGRVFHILPGCHCDGNFGPKDTFTVITTGFEFE